MQNIKITANSKKRRLCTIENKRLAMCSCEKSGKLLDSYQTNETVSVQNVDSQQNSCSLRSQEKRNFQKSNYRLRSTLKVHTGKRGRNSRVSRDGRTLSHKERDSHVPRDERPTSQPERDSHVPRDERPRAHQERDSRIPREYIPTSHQERDYHLSRDKISTLHKKRDSCVPCDERPTTHKERVSRVPRDEILTSHKQRDFRIPCEYRPTSHQERDSSVPRDEIHTPHNERDSRVPRDKRPMSHQERDFCVPREYIPKSHQEKDFPVRRTKHTGKTCQSLVDSKKGRLESEPSCSNHKHELQDCLQNRNERLQRKRKSDSLGGNEHVLVKKGKYTFDPIGYKALESICLIKDKNEAMLEIIRKEERYIALLNSENEIREDLFKLVIESLNIVIESTNRKTPAYEILQSTHQRLLLSHIPSFIFDQLPKMECNEQSQVLSKLIIIFEALLQRFPKNTNVSNGVRMIVSNLVSNILGKLADKAAAHHVDRFDAILKDIKDRNDRRNASDNDEMPPDNFRNISVIPTEADFKPGFRPFLRANVINSAYKDAEHYLDVQFRLLREDFIMSLRERIKELQKNGNGNHGRRYVEDNKRRYNTFLYEGVRIVNPVCHRSGGVYKIQVNQCTGIVKHLNWRNFIRNRLKFGSLVCLSPDGFKTLMFATTENRDLLNCGLLELSFENCDSQKMQNAIESNCVFEMIESEAYFEAYRHNLRALQTITCETLPFQECIVYCRNTNLPPKYLLEERTETPHDRESVDSLVEDLLETVETYDNLQSSNQDGGQGSYHNDFENLSDSDGKGEAQLLKYINMTSIADPEFLQNHKPDLSHVPVLNLQQWPNQEALGLDESQYLACQLALTNRFMLIQGPPGTGKTYVGLKIAQVLLDNPELWNTGTKSPILMVSFTNHALDQFLMGLDNKEGVVRVGGRSKEEKLDEYNLKNVIVKRRKFIAEDSNQRERGRIWKERKTIEEMYYPNEANRRIADGYNGVLPLCKLKDVMKPDHVSRFTSITNGECILEDAKLLQWLEVKPKQRRQDDRRCQQPQSIASRSVAFSLRDFEMEEEDDDYPTKIESPAVTCYIDDAEDSKCLLSNLQKQTMYEDDGKISDIFRLSLHQKWNLYRFWRFKLEQNYQERIRASREQGYETLLMRLHEIRADEDLNVLRDAKVIAMTTTCAARYRDLLQRVQPKIVIVEEAAEVLEAHILTSLPLNCDHVILIGDHQQLRPSCTVYEMAKKYNLNISMFERLVKRQMPCVKLTVQHRMRPEIAELMKHIYKDLANHASVEEYDDILGFKHNLYFIDHRHSDGQSNDGFSHFNEHEAEFLGKLCRYIIQQGYRSSQITVLTPYLGQMFTIKDHMNSGREDLTEIRVTTIDNYQGEENDIVLLSLVRSNDTGHVGFVNDINRACVALSRARMGLYVIGNFDLLSANSEIWRKVVDDVKRRGKIGKELPLCCQRHKTKILVKEPKDFEKKVPCGGCTNDCRHRLDCGHACTLPCHPYDQEHKDIRCAKPCVRTISGCSMNHKCRNLCGVPCEPRCLYQVKKTLSCGHIKNAPCSRSLEFLICDERCEKTLKCGHHCQARCGKPCTLECQELVKRNDWPCGHEVTIACSATPLACYGPCSAPSCGHNCSGDCGKCLQGRVHQRCRKVCGRLLVCGHYCNANCTTACPPCTKACETRCRHSNCKKSCGEICVPCKDECKWKCPHLKCNASCGEMCDRPRCNQPCQKPLQCKHKCRGLCSEPCICVECERKDIMEIFGTEDFDDVTVRFIQLRECEHIFEVTALDRWMDMENTDTGDKSIQPKVCPGCKTPIRTTMRYNNVIKKQLQDIEKVKEKILNKQQPFDKTRITVKIDKKIFGYLSDECSSADPRHERDCQSLRKMIGKAKHLFEFSSIENKLELLTRCNKLIVKATATQTKITEQTSTDMKEISWSISILKYLKKNRIIFCVEREIADIELELRRQKVVIEALALITETQARGIAMFSEHRILLDDIRKTLSQSSIVVISDLDSYLKKIEDARSNYPIDPPTREEKDQIIKAMGFSKGHWYKCRQGHIYAIGECGGAMESGICPECGDDIGGTSHRLAEGNEVATEMDGAMYSAWSERANMANYDLRE